jgi:hypothetical protein
MGYDAGKMGNLSHLKPGKAGDKAGIEYGLSDQSGLDVNSADPSLSNDSSAPGFSTQRITNNPVSKSASKNGKSFDID